MENRFTDAADMLLEEMQSWYEGLVTMLPNLVVALIVALAGFFVPVPLMALDLLIGLLQAYIFTILASVYVGAAIRVGEES